MLLSILINANRGKGSRPVTAKQLHPFHKTKKKAFDVRKLKSLCNPKFKGWPDKKERT